MTQLITTKANDGRMIVQMRNVRVVKDGWYHNGAPVILGSTVKMEVTDVQEALRIGRIEFA